MSSLLQILRIVLQLIAGFFLGDAVANSAELQGAISGLISIGTFIWWYFVNRRVTMVKKILK